MVTAAIPTAQQVASRQSIARRVADAIRLPSFLSAPALLAAVCFAAGILGARFAWYLPGLLLVSLLASFIVAAFAAARAPRLGWLTVSLVYLLLGLFSAEAAPRADPQKQLALLADNKPKLIQGEVIRLGPIRSVVSATPFSSTTHPEHSQQIDIRLLSPLGGSNSTVRTTLYAPIEQPFPRIACGDELQATLAMHTEERYLDPGVWDTGEYLHSQGIGALASVNPQKLAVLATHRSQSFACWLHSLERAASTRLIDFANDPGNLRLPTFLRISHEDATMLAAMLTGDRTYLQHRVRIGFERTGSFHLLVVSGMHLAIFSGLIFWLAQRLRLSRLWASLLTIGCSFAYALFTGFGHPVQRAFWMITLYLIGSLLWRERRALNTIGLVALALLAAEPGSLFDSGLQMTLLSVLAIAGIATPFIEETFGPFLHALRNLREIRIDPALPPRIAQFRVSLRMLAQHLRPITGTFLAWTALPLTLRFLLRVAELLVVSIAIELLMMLPMIAYFHRITLLSLPVNVLIVPFLGILLPSALLTFVTLLLAPALAHLPGAATAAILHTVVLIVSTFANMHGGDLRMPMPSPTVIALWITLTVFAIYAVRMRRFSLITAAAALVLAAVVVIVPHPAKFHRGQLEITAIDVGQGDSILVVTPEGKSLLIDAGGLVGASPDSNFDTGEDIVSPVLWSRGIRRLDAVALTHAHADHIGGMPAVIANFRPRALWVGRNPDVPVYERFLADGQSVGSQIRHFAAGDTFTFGGATIRVLAPASDYHPGDTPVNNDSLVMRVSYGNTSALLEGDAEAPSEERMLALGGLRSDLLKVGHHGSRTSTTPAFLAAVHPSCSVISVGRRNFYGHPRHEVLEELQNAHISTYRTDMFGLTSFYLDGTRVTGEPWAATATGSR